MENAVVTTSFNPVSLMPATFEKKLAMAQTLARSGLIPQGLNTAEKVCVALEWGHELQLSPMVAVNNIAVINGKATLSADIMAAVVKRSPEYGGIEWIQQTDKIAECEVTRILPNGKTEKVRSSFSMEDATKAGLASRDVWRKYPKRMLKHRCQTYALKDAFPDILAGLYTPEEMENISAPIPNEEQEMRNVTPTEQYDEPMETVVLPTEDAGEITNRQKLIYIVEHYKAQLEGKGGKGTPYDLCCEALAEENEEKIVNCIDRCYAYLGKKGITVQVA